MRRFGFGFGIPSPRRTLADLYSYIARLFAANEPGLWIDPSDLSTLFQDTAGTIPVTAPGQQVALALDKSGREGRVIQPTALARPTLGRHPVGGTRNLLVGSEGQRGWTAIGTSPPAVSAATHLGKPCWGITFPAGLTSAGWNVSRAVYPPQTYPFPGAYSWRYKVATNRPLLPGETVVVMLNGSFATAGVNFTSADNLTQWVDRSVPNIVYAATLNAGLYPAITNVTTLGEPLTVYITDMQTEAGSVITPYQRVASDWDVTEAGKRDCWYLGFDGVDDWLYTQLILNMSSVSEFTVFAGLRKEGVSGSGAHVICELGPITQDTIGGFFLAAPDAPSRNNTGVAVRGLTSMVSARSPDSSAVPPASVVLTGRGNTSNGASIRQNGVETTNPASGGGGRLASGTRIIVGSRNGTSLFLKGKLYQLGVVGGWAGDAQVVPVEALIADTMGTTS